MRHVTQARARGRINFAITRHTRGEEEGEYGLVLDTDWEDLGGHGRRDRRVTGHTQNIGYNNRKNQMKVYLPSRTGAVWARLRNSRA